MAAMSYQVLARKWRPKSFEALVGQEHVVRALSHALETARLHHAYLFTGTRGVGKTTIARILAKSLNCDSGVSAAPCGSCSACVAIDADRFPDYVEMDAASNRGVEDMASLLDKAVYAPVQGRYKVYMIDEVHMLTGHAFNAMLKTLEEPPEHVKFILATTDPQRIPVTVLSRCLQFNLKQMPPAAIVEHLQRVLEAEQVSFEQGALRHLAKGAGGSMRDALSLLDQAIAHGAGKVAETQVIDMLGTVGDDYLFEILDGVIDADVSAMLAVADRMAARSLSFEAALQGLASLLQRIAVLQFAPDAEADQADGERLAGYAEALDREFLQLAYQIAIHGRDDLPLAPDGYAGFTMTLLRLHAFRPDNSGGKMASPTPAAPAGHARPVARRDSTPAPAMQPPVTPAAQAPVDQQRQADIAHGDCIPPWEDLPEVALGVPSDGGPAAGDKPVPRASVEAPADVPPAAATTGNQTLPEWPELIVQAGLGGMVRELAQHCEWVGSDSGRLRLRLSHTHRHLLTVNRATRDKLQSELARHLGRDLRLDIELGAIAGETPAQRNEQLRSERRAAAVASLEQDPFVSELIERFDATLLESSIKALEVDAI